MKSNENSWVLITGASSGFGEEFARQYAAQGKSLVLVARRLSKLEALSAQLRERFGVDVIVEQVDLSSIPAIIELHERLSERNVVIDVLINNAGHGLQGPFLDQPLDESLTMIDFGYRQPDRPDTPFRGRHANPQTWAHPDGRKLAVLPGREEFSPFTLPRKPMFFASLMRFIVN